MMIMMMKQKEKKLSLATELFLLFCAVIQSQWKTSVGFLSKEPGWTELAYKTMSSLQHCLATFIGSLVTDYI